MDMEKLPHLKHCEKRASTARSKIYSKINERVSGRSIKNIAKTKKQQIETNEQIH